MDFTGKFRVPAGGKVRLARIDPDSTPGLRGKAQGLKVLARNLERLDRLQYDLYAEHRRSVLIVLQALDAGGKDGTIRKITEGLNPQGCRVTSFKVPSAEEASHDFLWRIHRAVPARGEIGIFNRSHYEDVLVVRVHGLVPRSVWSRRYEQINAFERHLAENGVTILKFFLHISRDEQKQRLLERLEDPRKQWKFSLGDLEERKRWDDYQAAYEDALNRCSTDVAPWFVIPANRNWYRNAVVSQIFADALDEMAPRPPRPEIDLDKIRIE